MAKNAEIGGILSFFEVLEMDSEQRCGYWQFLQSYLELKNCPNQK
jgi:hypothetical protein